MVRKRKRSPCPPLGYDVNTSALGGHHFSTDSLPSAPPLRNLSKPSEEPQQTGPARPWCEGAIRPRSFAIFHKLSICSQGTMVSLLPEQNKMGRDGGILGNFDAEFQRCVQKKEKGPIIGQSCTISGIEVNVFSRISAETCQNISNGGVVK